MEASCHAVDGARTEGQFLLGYKNVRPFPIFSTFYGAKYFISLYNTILNYVENNIFRPFWKTKSAIKWQLA